VYLQKDILHARGASWHISQRRRRFAYVYIHALGQRVNNVRKLTLFRSVGNRMDERSIPTQEE
jgi:hypothetical protein